jgi:hypothetical protein
VLLDEPPELVEGLVLRAGFVLRDGELDVGEDEAGVEFRTAAVLGDGLVVGGGDEVDLTAVVEAVDGERRK